MMCPKCEAYVVETTKVCWNCKYIIQKDKPQLDKEDDEFKKVTMSFSEYRKLLKEQKEEQNDNKTAKFYDSTWFMWVMILTFYPLGLFLMWRHGRYSIFVRIIITILCILSAYYGNLYLNQNGWN